MSPRQCQHAVAIALQLVRAAHPIVKARLLTLSEASTILDAFDARATERSLWFLNTSELMVSLVHYGDF